MVVLLNITSPVSILLCNKLGVRPSAVNVSRTDSPPLICFGCTALTQTAEKVAKLRQNCDKVCQVFKNFWDMANEEPNILMRKILVQQGIKSSREEAAKLMRIHSAIGVSVLMELLYDSSSASVRASFSAPWLSSPYWLILSSLAKYLLNLLLGWRMCNV